LTLELLCAAFGGMVFLSFHPRPPRLSEPRLAMAGRREGQKKNKIMSILFILSNTLRKILKEDKAFLSCINLK